MIDDFKLMSKGIGGSYTRWQSKPPSHGVFWVETENGQTAFTAYNTSARVLHDDDHVVIDDGATGPGNKPFKSEVGFSDLPIDVRDRIETRVVETFREEDFFDDP